MTLLSAALEARDKATLGPWNRYQYDHGGSRIFNGNELIADTFEPKENGEVIFAAPDALDWIAKALPTVKEKAQGLTRLKREYEVGIKLAAGHQIDRFQTEIESITAELATLTALIAQAEGTKT